VSEGKVVLCDDYGVGVLGGRMVQDCFPFLLCEATYVDGVTIERFGEPAAGKWLLFCLIWEVFLCLFSSVGFVLWTEGSRDPATMGY